MLSAGHKGDELAIGRERRVVSVTTKVICLCVGWTGGGEIRTSAVGFVARKKTAAATRITAVTPREAIDGVSIAAQVGHSSRSPRFRVPLHPLQIRARVRRMLVAQVAILLQRLQTMPSSSRGIREFTALGGDGARPRIASSHGSWRSSRW